MSLSFINSGHGNLGFKANGSSGLKPLHQNRNGVLNYKAQPVACMPTAAGIERAATQLQYAKKAPSTPMSLTLANYGLVKSKEREQQRQIQTARMVANVVNHSYEDEDETPKHGLNLKTKAVLTCGACLLGAAAAGGAIVAASLGANEGEVLKFMELNNGAPIELPVTVTFQNDKTGERVVVDEINPTLSHELQPWGWVGRYFDIGQREQALWAEKVDTDGRNPAVHTGRRTVAVLSGEISRAAEDAVEASQQQDQRIRENLIRGGEDLLNIPHSSDLQAVNQRSNVNLELSTQTSQLDQKLQRRGVTLPQEQPKTTVVVEYPNAINEFRQFGENQGDYVTTKLREAGRNQLCDWQPDFFNPLFRCNSPELEPATQPSTTATPAQTPASPASSPQEENSD